MLSFKNIWNLVRQEAQLEWRQRFAINGIFLYVAATVFVVYLSFIFVRPEAWNSLFWIIMLFAAINAVAKSFIQESSGRHLYFYTLAGPQEIILSKIFYNLVLLLFLALINVAAFMLFLGNPVQNIWLFCLIVLLGAAGFSFSFTMLSAIAGKAQNSSTLMTILSLPVILPQLLLVIRLTARALSGATVASASDQLFALLALDVVSLVVSYLLFPYLWRE